MFQRFQLLCFYIPQDPSTLIACFWWSTSGSASGLLEICPSGSPEDRRWQPQMDRQRLAIWVGYARGMHANVKENFI